jgi:hypothetical protein
MKKPRTIPRAGTLDTCTNYHELLGRGLAYCQELGGDLWTDFNEHDPGVTILENLCYALTDLSYRTDFDVPDLLAVPAGTHQPEQPLYAGDRILTCNPLTPSDYRKLLYDRIKGLKNAWLVPVTDHPLGVEGLYRVLVEMREEITAPAEIEEIRSGVRQLMQTARNLGEDVDEIRILQPQPIRVQATIEIGAKADPANVLAQVLFAIQNSMIPFPQVQLVDELFRAEMAPDQIWNGPLLNHGALDRQSLTDRKKTIQVEEIAHIILQVPGVKRVKNLMAGPPQGPLSCDPVTIMEDHVPRLDPPILSPQPFYTINVELEGGFKSAVNSRAVWSKIQELETGMRKNIAYAARSMHALAYLQPRTGNYRNIENYFSIQHHFPAVYGLCKRGATDALLESATLAAGSGNARQGRIRQLKAYLLFFEQPLADYLAQLSHVGDLFSTETELHQSYFYQPLAHTSARDSEPPGIAQVLLQQPPEQRHGSAYYLVCIVDTRGKIFFVTRRLSTQHEAQEIRRQIIESGQQLDHYRITTMRSGEVLLALHSSSGAFLAQGQERFTSTAAARDAAERWVGFMRGLQGVKHLLEKLVRVFRREDFSLQIIDDRSRIVLASNLLQTQEERERRVQEVLASGIHPGHYRFRTLGPGRVTIHLHDSRGNLIAEGKEIFETEFDAEEGVDELVRLLRTMEQRPELRGRHLRRLPEVEETSRGPLDAYYHGLEQLAHQTDRNYLKRRNRILNHLLARFSERFDDAILERLDLRAFGEKDDFYHDLIRWKIEFLRGYVEQEKPQAGPDGAPVARDGAPVSLGAGRGQGFDYSAAEGSGAVSGLERRVSLLLGFHGHSGEKGYQSGLQQPSSPGHYYLEKEVHSLKPERDENTSFIVARQHIAGPRAAGEPDLHDLHNNFVFASEDSSVSRLLLAYGTSPESYRIQERDDKYRILFHASAGGQATEIHHAHSRKEAEDAIAALVRYFRDLRQSTDDCYGGERMHVLEHVLLRPRQVSSSRPVHICDEKSHAHLSVPAVPEKQEDHLDLVFHHGGDPANYRVHIHESGKYYLALHVNERPIATGTRFFEDKEDASAEIHKLAELLRFLHHEPKARRKHIRAAAKDDFYSQRISVLLPNWPMRFQNNEFRLYAEQLLAENAPAHLAVNCFWLSVHEMQEFERLHQEWKSLMRAAHGREKSAEQEHARNNVSALDAVAAELKKIIEALESRQHGPGPADDGGAKAGRQ